MRIERNRAMRIIKISQPDYIENLLKAYQIYKAKSQASPMEININNTLIATPKGFKADSEDVIAFKSGLELLIYLII